MRHITIATPILGQMDPRVTASLMDASSALTASGIGWTWEVLLGDAVIARARNVLVHRFLASSSDRLVFLDADITFSPEDLFALLAREEDLVAGDYQKKVDGRGCVGVVLSGGETRGTLVEASHVGTGFLALSRACLERMVLAHPETLYRAGSECDESGATVSALFDTALRGGRYVGEDYLFCERWRAIGGRCWLHTGLRLGHVGSHVYGASHA